VIETTVGKDKYTNDLGSGATLAYTAQQMAENIDTFSE
jgi:hypothetical protein